MFKRCLLYLAAMMLIGVSFLTHGMDTNVGATGGTQQDLITVFVDGRHFNLPKKVFDYLKSQKELVEAFSPDKPITEPIPLDVFNQFGWNTFDVLIRIIQDCFVDQDVPDVPRLMSMLRTLSLDELYNVLRVSAAAEFDALYAYIITALAKRIRNGNIAGDNLKRLVELLDDTALVYLKEHFIGYCKHYMKQQRIRQSTATKLIGLPRTSSDEAIISLNGERMCIQINDDLVVIQCFDGKEIARIQNADGIALKFSNNAHYVLIKRENNRENNIVVWNLIKNEITTFIPMISRASHYESFSPDDTKLCIMIDNGYYRMFSGDDFKYMQSIDMTKQFKVDSFPFAAWSPDSRYCCMQGTLSLATYGIIMLYDTYTNKLKYKMRENFGASMFVSVDNNNFLLCDNEGIMRRIQFSRKPLAFDIYESKEPVDLEGSVLQDMRISNDKKFIIISEENGSLIIDAQSGIILKEVGAPFPAAWTLDDDIVIYNYNPGHKQIQRLLCSYSDTDKAIITGLSARVSLLPVIELVRMMDTVAARGAIPTQDALISLLQKDEVLDEQGIIKLASLLGALMRTIKRQTVVFDLEDIFNISDVAVFKTPAISSGVNTTPTTTTTTSTSTSTGTTTFTKADQNE